LILNEIGLKNNLKIDQSEIQNEIQKQIKSMPGQEKMVMDYYKNNQNALASLRGVLYEDKVIELIKTKIKLEKKAIKTKEAEEILKKINEDSGSQKSSNVKKQVKKSKIRKKK
jgi:FKBP-type peptidyl-prolyl cis-trans isomerase (trigger factor)